MENPLDGIEALATELSIDYETTMTAFLKIKTEDGTGFDLSELIPQINRPLHDLNKRMTSLFGLVKGLPANANFSIVPDSIVSQLLSNLKATGDRLIEVNKVFDQIGANGGVSAIDKPTLTVIHRNGDQRSDFGDLFKQICEVLPGDRTVT